MASGPRVQPNKQATRQGEEKLEEESGARRGDAMGARLCGLKHPAESTKRAATKGERAIANIAARKLNARKTHERPLGYTVESFVQHNLVPVEGFCCVGPTKPTPMETEARDKALKEEIAKLHKQMNVAPDESLFDDAAGQVLRVFGGRQIQHVDATAKVPLEATCRVWLDEAEVMGDVQQSFDFNQEARLEVVVSGLLLFPPDGYPLNMSKHDYKALSAPKEAKAPVDVVHDKLRDKVRWHLKVEIDTVLERDLDAGRKDIARGTSGTSSAVSMTSTSRSRSTRGGSTEGISSSKSAATFRSAADGAQTRLRVRCLELHVNDRDDQSGDPMVDSWLPRASILNDIEGLLAAKLRLSTAEKS